MLEIRQYKETASHQLQREKEADTEMVDFSLHTVNCRETLPVALTKGVALERDTCVKFQLFCNTPSF